MAKGEKCSFCGRGENEVRLLMPGRDGCICDECAEQAYLLSEEYLHKKKKAILNEEILKAIAGSSKSYEEILDFIQGKREE